ncbi:DUF429 domain-containing protein [Saccharibacillus sp. JS10]|uniref:DUF429 domain-containing protein n=1 Tax=Saccharibacillus sp. JS10 TaxID=2950552 RepID=UPI00210914A8|nr:DUF429 domain-containing protein [Saccharibacillus sp. JS10]MCQ4088363.1 DUF429 domain-containing protein [Saccharibacillus sp. JS10]
MSKEKEAHPSPLYRGIGIDGCPAGWIAALIEASAEATEFQRIRSAVYPTITDLWADLNPNPDYDHVLIDIPIGLPEGIAGKLNSVEDRKCDRDCRKLLPKSRKSSVFPVPVRQALRAEDPSAINFSVTGRKLSRQSIHILPKISEVDDFIAQRLKRQLPVAGFIEESHPELVFLNLNTGIEEVPLYRKKEAEGQRERLRILQASGLSQTQMEQQFTLFLRKHVAKDDLLDAAALAVAAHRIASNSAEPRYVTKSSETQYDYEGSVQMNIVYVRSWQAPGI